MFIIALLLWQYSCGSFETWMIQILVRFRKELNIVDDCIAEDITGSTNILILWMPTRIQRFFASQFQFMLTEAKDNKLS